MPIPLVQFPGLPQDGNSNNLFAQCNKFPGRRLEALECSNMDPLGSMKNMHTAHGTIAWEQQRLANLR
ncbi:predicted protein [Plenodomus lingam JN3]|uniref:Predicted protein n=1 Tax=Leptosphaeria maculans (strain JN3 / isolate v23.1.3 / race Av1-4-5-6-7-8) TaxID=985895 RepID=E4ZLF7_LEPMJ|nr:predicted protein [Plenodomus lingam JN3]CBX92316.1 predicted protein [Plenodomus lingam JN3]